jgi:arylformamidase
VKAKHLFLLLSLMISSAYGTPEESDLFLVARDLSYGDIDQQKLDVYYRSGSARLPVVIYVHGGGWAFGSKEDVYYKPQYFDEQDVAFISMDYRLRWDYETYDQAEDIVSVIKWVQDNAATYGLNEKKIVLMGHAAGAHLVSLVGTNESYLKAGGRQLSDISAVISIDMGSYDIERLMIELGSFIERRQHRLIFGNEQQYWREASPVSHVEADKGIPSFALLYVADDEESTLQAKGFAKVLSQAGVETIMIPGNEKTSDSIDELLGSPGDKTTQALMAFLRAKI